MFYCVASWTKTTGSNAITRSRLYICLLAFCEPSFKAFAFRLVGLLTVIAYCACLIFCWTNEQRNWVNQFNCFIICSLEREVRQHRVSSESTSADWCSRYQTRHFAIIPPPIVVTAETEHWLMTACDSSQSKSPTTAETRSGQFIIR